MLKRVALGFLLFVLLINSNDAYRYYHKNQSIIGWLEKFCVCGGVLHATYWLGLDDHHM